MGAASHETVSGGDGPRVIGFLMAPRFSMIAFASAIEPLRLANRVSGRTLYEWRVFSPDGQPACASNGVEVSVSGPCSKASKLYAAFVCAGVDVQTFDHREMIATLRRLSSFGSMIGAVCTGSWVLAKAGLLDGYRATIHWENRAGFLTDFPLLDVSSELYEIDRTRLTCAGGTAALDMMLSLIARDHGEEITSLVTDQLIHHRMREADEQQRMDLRARLGVTHPRLLSVIQLMETTLERPLSCARLARHAQCSARQLERLFQRYIGHPPARHYLTLRLERARSLLRQTSMPILSVAMACGFVSASHFSKSYHEHFGRTPTAERRPGDKVAAPAVSQGEKQASPSRQKAKDARPENGSTRSLPREETMADELDLNSLSDDELVQQMHEDLYDGLKEEIEEGVRILLDRGWTPYDVLTKSLVAGMQIVGVDFRDGILFVPEVLMSANAMKAGMAILRPLLAQTGAPKIGKMVIGTVKGDIHDIGKNLVTMMMEGAGFEVIDIGINNPVENFLAALEEHQPDILGMSALLTTTMPYMKVVIDTLKEKGIRNDYVVLVGGAPLNEAFADAVGADAYCRDAAIAVETAKDWMSRRQGSALSVRPS